MDNNFDFSDFRDFCVDAWYKIFENVEEYVSYLSTKELILVSVFLVLLILVFFWLFFRMIENKIYKTIQKRREERKALLKNDMRLDRAVVQDDEFSSDEEQAVDDNSDQLNSFDWSRENKISADIEGVEQGDMQYKRKPRRLQDLLGLIVDLLSRGVEDIKLAQVIMFKNQHLNSEDDVIYTIAAVKMFVKMCRNGAFRHIDSDKLLPNENVALFNLAKGDVSLALLLLETYIDDELDNIKCLGDDNEKRRKIAKLAELSVCFGTFAMFEDVNLASGAFELAVELDPHNTIAWSRLGDAYRYMEKNDKAVWAYVNVLNSDDDDVCNQQTTNASRALYAYYKENGKKDQAAKMLEKASEYYDKIGINVPLTERESKIIDIVEANEEDSLEDIVDTLLYNR